MHESTQSLIDLANRADKLNIINDADTLLLIRDIRNQISHEYDDENLNIIYNQIFELAHLLKEDIFKSIIESQLPATILQMIINEIKVVIDGETAQIVQKEKAEYTKSMEAPIEK